MKSKIFILLAFVFSAIFFTSCEYEKKNTFIEVSNLNKKPFELYSFMGENFDILIDDLEYSGLVVLEETSSKVRLTNPNNTLLYYLECNSFKKVDYARVEYFTNKQTEAIDRYGYWHNDFYDYGYGGYYGEIFTYDQDLYQYNNEVDFITDYSNMKYMIHNCLEDWIGAKYALGIDYYTMNSIERRVGIQVLDKNLLKSKPEYKTKRQTK